MVMKHKPLNIPPTRSHHQLAAWINVQSLVDSRGLPIIATVERSKYDTSSNIKGTRLRHEGKGRWGLVLEIWLKNRNLKVDFWHNLNRLYSHNSGETYRRHEEARRWVAENLSPQ